MDKSFDLTGQHFGRLEVLGPTEDRVRKDGKHEKMWLCRCGCPKKTLMKVRGTDLRNGRRICCGCISHEKRRKRNEYYIIDNVVHVKIKSNMEMLCDPEDWEKLRQYCWGIKDKSGYARARVEGQTKQFHTMVMPQSSRGVYVDHINGNVLDNRKKNLRYATPKQSVRNTGIREDNTSGVKGVSYNKRAKKYEAYIHDGKKISLGLYDTLDEARQARIKKEKELLK